MFVSSSVSKWVDRTKQCRVIYWNKMVKIYLPCSNSRYSADIVDDHLSASNTDSTSMNSITQVGDEVE